MFTNRFGANGRNKPASTDVQKPITLVEAVGGVSSHVYLIRDRVQRKLLFETEGQVNADQQPQMRQLIENLFNQVLAEENLLSTRTNRQRLLDWVMADILGYGPLEPLLSDPSITEVMAVGPKRVYAERHGLIEKTSVTFENDSHLVRISGLAARTPGTDPKRRQNSHHPLAGTSPLPGLPVAGPRDDAR